MTVASGQRRCEVRGGCALSEAKSLESSRFGLRMTDFKKNLASQLDFE